MVFRRGSRIGLTGLVVVLGLAPAALAPARAFDLFGLFGERAPAPTAEALPYELTIETEDGDLRTRLRDASGLYRLRADAPPDGETLVRRAQADLSPLVDALWSEGYYDGKVEITVAGVPVRPPAGDGSDFDALAAPARAAQALRNRAAVPVVIRVAPGARFRLRGVDVGIDAPRGETIAPPPARVVGLDPGDPARAAELRAANVRMIDYYRARSRPLAKARDIAATVDHRVDAMDVRYLLAPGPIAAMGRIELSGTQAVDPAVVRSFIYAQPGDAYSPAAVAAIRKSVARIPALGSVRIREGTELDPDGTLPLFVDVTERPPRLFGVSARYSTTDGPALRTYWEHRNLFGGAEQLRFEAETFLLPRNDGTRIKSFADFEPGDFGGRFRTTFVKPALGGTRNDFLAGLLIERDRTGGDRFGGFTSRMIDLTGSIRHRFTDTFSVQGGLEFERGQTSDVLGKVDYRLFGVPLALNYDSTDNPLEPTRGFKAIASLTPYPEFLGSSVGFTEGRATVSAYRAFDEESRFVLAGRLGFGTAFGADLAAIPANHRFFAGGGGSVRGYRSRSLGPVGPGGIVVGGRSLLEASLEARFRVTQTIGIVPFLDAGGAFESAFPDFKERVRTAAGIGLRYYTAIGPIRLDVATPLNRRAGDKPVAVYISVGQAF